MKEKGNHLHTLEEMRKTRYIGPECRRKGFSNLVDLTAVIRLRDFSPSLKR